MAIANVATHSVDIARLKEGGFVLDAGCRDFTFARQMAALGCRVVALDPDVIEVQDIDRVAYLQEGLAATSGFDQLVLMDNLEMRHLAKAAGHSQWHERPRIPVTTVSIRDLMQRFGVKHWACVKMDIEGAEYEILRTWPGPVADQITVEFHDHLEPRPPALYDEIFVHLGKWYDVVVRVPGDTLFVLRREEGER